MRTSTVVSVLLTLLPVMAMADELVATPGWPDGFFDSSDHQISGIDVYVGAPGRGASPEPSSPAPVEVEEKGAMLVEVPRREAAVPDAAALGAARRLAIVYADGTVQLVALRQPFGAVRRLTALPGTDTAAVSPGAAAGPAAR